MPVSGVPGSPLEFLWFGLLGLASVIIFIFDKSKPFENYLKPVLENRGLKYISSKYCRLGFYNNPFNTEDEDVTISRISGGLGAVQINVYSAYRKVVFEDKDGNKHEVLASLDFKSYWTRKLKRIRWFPNLDGFI